MIHRSTIHLKTLEYHLLDAGHFALETNGHEIATLMCRRTPYSSSNDASGEAISSKLDSLLPVKTVETIWPNRVFDRYRRFYANCEKTWSAHPRAEPPTKLALPVKAPGKRQARSKERKRGCITFS